MKDLLNNDLFIGDKIAFLPNTKTMQYEIQFGIISKFTKDHNKAYCKSLTNNNTLIRNSNMIIKL
jgi:hypothetical protein